MSRPSNSRAVVLGLSPTGLYAVRELARAGLQVLGVEHGVACGRYSRFVRRSAWTLPSLDGLLERLLAFARQDGDVPVLVPTSDAFVEFVMTNAERLSPAFRFVDAYRGVASDLLDKARFHSLCRRHGIATPGVWRVADSSDWSTVFEQAPFPCILKPELVHRAKAFLRGRKVLVVRGRGDLERAVRSIPTESGGWLVQEIVPGPESNITLFGGHFAGNGTVCQQFTARKLRQYPPGFGSASLVISEECEETRAISVQLLKAIGFSGICGTEFKRDPRDGRLKIIEVNPRPTLWFQLAHASGKRLVESVWRELAGLPPLAESAQRNSIIWRYGLKDLASASFYRFRGRSFVFPPPELAARSDAVAHCWPVFDPEDPRPALMEPLLFVRKAVRRAR